MKPKLALSQPMSGCPSQVGMSSSRCDLTVDSITIPYSLPVMSIMKDIPWKRLTSIDLGSL